MRHSSCFRDTGYHTKMNCVGHDTLINRKDWRGHSREFMKTLKMRRGGLRTVPCTKVGSPQLCLWLWQWLQEIWIICQGSLCWLGIPHFKPKSSFGSDWGQGSTRGTKWKSSKRSIYCHQQKLWDIMLPTLIGTHTHLISISCRRATSIPLIAVKRNYLLSIQDTKLILLPCFSQSKFQNNGVPCMSALPRLPLPSVWHLRCRVTNTTCAFSFLLYNQTQPPTRSSSHSSARVVLSCQGVAVVHTRFQKD